MRALRWEGGCCLRAEAPGEAAKGGWVLSLLSVRASITGCRCMALISAQQHGSRGTCFCPLVIST